MNLFNLVATLTLDTSKYKKEIEEAQSKNKGMISSLNSLDGGLTKLSKGVLAAGTAMIGLNAATIETQRDLSKLKTNASQSGTSMDLLSDSMAYLNAVTGETDSNVEALSNLMQTGLDDTQMQTALDGLAGAVIAFPDTLKIEGLADGLQETIATGQGIGQFGELLERSGISLDVFNAEMATATTEAERTDIAMQYLAKTGMAEVNEAYKENNKQLIENQEASYKFEEAMATLGAAVQPIVTDMMNLATSVLPILANWLGENQGLVVGLGIGILGLTGAVKGALAINSLINSLKAFKAALIASEIASKAAAAATTIMTGAQRLLNAAMKANPILLIISLIAGLITAYIAFSDKNTELKEQFQELGEKLMEMFATIMEAIQPIIDLIIQIGTQIIELLMPIFLQLVELVTPAIEFIITIIGKILDAISPIIEALGKVLKPIVEALEPVFDAVFGFIADVIGGAVDAIQWLIDKAKVAIDVVGGLIGQLGDLGEQQANSRFGIPNNFAGTNSWSGGLTWVHEKGGEILDLPQGTRIIPHDVSMEMARTAGNMAGTTGTSDSEVASLLMQILKVITNDARMIAIIKAAIESSNMTMSLNNREFGRLVKSYD